MPRTINPKAETERVEKLMEAQPNRLYPTTSKMPAALYIRLLGECARSGHPLSHQIRQIVGEHFGDGADRLVVRPDAAAITNLRLLASLWAVTPEEAVVRLLDRTATALLDQELRVREAGSRYMQTEGGVSPTAGK